MYMKLYEVKIINCDTVNIHNYPYAITGIS